MLHFFWDTLYYDMDSVFVKNIQYSIFICTAVHCIIRDSPLQLYTKVYSDKENILCHFSQHHTIWHRTIISNFSRASVMFSYDMPNQVQSWCPGLDNDWVNSVLCQSLWVTTT